MYRVLYHILLGGARLRRTVLMLETWSLAEEVKHSTGGFEPGLYCAETLCRYYLGVREGSKRVATSTSRGSLRGSESRG